MSSVPSWKKHFLEGIECFRRQDIDKALESFDKVKETSFSWLERVHGLVILRRLSALPTIHLMCYTTPAHLPTKSRIASKMRCATRKRLSRLPPSSGTVTFAPLASSPPLAKPALRYECAHYHWSASVMARRAKTVAANFWICVSIWKSKPNAQFRLCQSSYS